MDTPRNGATAAAPTRNASDPTLKSVLLVIATVLSIQIILFVVTVTVLRPLLAPSVAVAAPGAGGSNGAAGTITAVAPTNSGKTAFVVANGKVTVIENVYNQNRKKSEWKAVGVVPLR